MPFTYAHYRFGTTLLRTMPGDVARTIQRFRGMFDVGLHGPDIFSFYAPLLHTGARYLCIKYHEQTGQEFFPRACRCVRLEKSEASAAYLYGVLCHYCLDSVMHPYIAEQAKQLGIPQLEIEVEFDRYLLEKDGKTPPCSQDLSPHLRLTPGESETVAKLYPPATGRNVQDAVKQMARLTKLLAAPEGARRTVLEKGAGLFGKELKGIVMPSAPNPKCAHLDEALWALYEQAAEQFQRMLPQLQAHLTYSAPFEKEFEPIFG